MTAVAQSDHDRMTAADLVTIPRQLAGSGCAPTPFTGWPVTVTDVPFEAAGSI